MSSREIVHIRFALSTLSATAGNAFEYISSMKTSILLFRTRRCLYQSQLNLQLGCKTVQVSKRLGTSSIRHSWMKYSVSLCVKQNVILWLSLKPSYPVLVKSRSPVAITGSHDCLGFSLQAVQIRRNSAPLNPVIDHQYHFPNKGKSDVSSFPPQTILS